MHFAVCRDECDGGQFKEDQEGTSSTDCRDYQEVKVQEQVRFNMLDQTEKCLTTGRHQTSKCLTFATHQTSK